MNIPETLPKSFLDMLSGVSVKLPDADNTSEDCPCCKIVAKDAPPSKHAYWCVVATEARASYREAIRDRRFEHSIGEV